MKAKDVMSHFWKSRTFLSLLVGVVMAYPMFYMGGYFFVCWCRIHISDVYYMDFSYLTAAMIWTGIALISPLCALYGVWRKKLRFLVVVPVVLFFVSGALIPSIGLPPRATHGRILDRRYITLASLGIREWSNENKRFPVNDLEYQEAIDIKVSVWGALPESPYRQRGRVLPYEVVISTDATGARTNDVSTRPRVIYYCVSSDMQECWVTMTSLDTDVGAFATILSSSFSNDDYVIFHAVIREQKKGIK